MHSEMSERLLRQTFAIRKPVERSAAQYFPFGARTVFPENTENILLPH
jgi:hypothetical protein